MTPAASISHLCPRPSSASSNRKAATFAATSSNVTAGNRVRGLWSRIGKSTGAVYLDCGRPRPYNALDEMRLYSGKIPSVGTEIVKALVEAGDIEVTDRAEAEMDVQAVLKEYLRLEREITDKAKDLLQKRNLPYEQFGKIKRTIAGEKAF